MLAFLEDRAESVVLAGRELEAWREITPATDDLLDNEEEVRRISKVDGDQEFLLPTAMKEK